jgi:hypothetical protein
MAQAVRRYLTVLANGEVCGLSAINIHPDYHNFSQITPLKLQREVNTVIIPALGLDLGGQKISENCAQRWLVKLGYELKEVKKGMYVDGHECEDVVEYWKTYLAEVSKNTRSVYTEMTIQITVVLIDVLDCTELMKMIHLNLLSQFWAQVKNCTFQYSMTSPYAMQMISSIKYAKDPSQLRQPLRDSHG